MDFVAMPYKYHLQEGDDAFSQIGAEANKANFDNIMQVDWPYNYVAAIKAAMPMGKILVIPSDSGVLELLREENIEYSLYYPQREAKEIYRERYICRGNTEDFLSVFIDGWDGFMDILEADPSNSHVILQSHEYLSDVIRLLSVTMCESQHGADIRICNELSAEIPKNDDCDLSFTCSYGPDSDEGVDLGSRLSDVAKYYSNGPKPPEDENFVCVATINIAYLITNTDALSTLNRLELLGNSFRITEWKARTPEEVIDFLRGRKYGIAIDGNVINFGSDLIDKESMEVLCMLDLLEKPIKGWREKLV